jgi:uncharacterized protein YifN (PemK superfamily)
LSFPEPEAGLVIRYSYLWTSENDDGLEEGTKDRPCAIVLAVKGLTSNRRVTVLPITHTEPKDLALAIEIPANVKKRLGLDDGRSWIVVTEGNEFSWPGPDLRAQPGQDLSSVAYGFLPRGLHAEMLRRFLAFAKQGLAMRVQRSE